MELKLCIDCKHCKAFSLGGKIRYECKADFTSPVDGSFKLSGQSMRLEAFQTRMQLCGLSATMFEQKQDTNIEPKITTAGITVKRTR